jgi:phage terminase large subunit-like protein
MAKPTRLTSISTDRATAYAKRVVAGKEPAGPHVRAACARHLRDLKEGPARGLKWDKGAARRAIGFFEDVLKLNGGEHEGKPFLLLLWQAFIIGSLFGWKAPDGFRRFRMGYIEAGKGSGKSPLAAGIGLYMQVADNEARAEIYAAATKKDQAMVLYRDAVAMVDQSPPLQAKLTKSGVGLNVWNLAYLQTASFFRPISSDDGQSGPRPHCALIDEIHEHKTGQVVEMMRAGTKGRRQALILMITNSGYDRTSVCYQYHDYGAKVSAGELEDDSFFSYTCALDEDDDPFEDVTCWAKANPSLGITFQKKYLEEQVLQARGMPSKESIVRRLNFCQWVDAANPWIDGDLWRKCQVEFSDADVAGLPCSLGLDLSSKRDLTALAAVWRGVDRLYARVWFWTPLDTLEERARQDNVPYRAWLTRGFLEAPAGRSIDYIYAARKVAELCAANDVVALAFDQWRIDDFTRDLDEAGVESFVYEGEDKPCPGTGLRLHRHGQGWGGGGSESMLWMPRSITLLEDAVIKTTLQVKPNPVLNWASASAVLEADPTGNKKWEKRKSTGRIDGIVALSMAVGAAMQQAEPQGESFWMAA